MAKSYKTISNISDLYVELTDVEDVGYGEVGTIDLEDGEERAFQVIDVDRERAVLQLFDNAMGISPLTSKVRFSGKKMSLGVNEDILSRVFDGIGRPVDGAPELLADKYLSVEGAAVNPMKRELPMFFIDTGISGIDECCPIARGQSMAILADSGIAHLRVASYIAEHSKMTLVFAALGTVSEETDLFLDNLRKSGAMDDSVVFLNFASDSVLERLAAPKFAMTCAEYLAFEKDRDVLVILSDMASYADAYHQSDSAEQESLYSAFASIVERGGRRKDASGSITVLPMMTICDDEKTVSAAEDLCRATEGRMVLSKQLYDRGIYPPVDTSLSFSHYVR